jgi:hypothetical protein
LFRQPVRKLADAREKRRAPAANSTIMCAPDIAEAGFIYGLQIVMNYAVMYEYAVDRNSAVQGAIQSDQERAAAAIAQRLKAALVARRPRGVMLRDPTSA